MDILKLHQINKHVLRDVSYSCDQTDSGVEAGGEGGGYVYMMGVLYQNRSHLFIQEPIS